MDTRQKIEAFIVAQKGEKESPSKVIAYTRGREMNLKNNDPTKLIIVEEGKKESRVNKFNTNTQADSNDSYKAQKSNFQPDKPQNPINLLEFWANAQPLMKEKVGKAAYQTLISSLKPQSLENNVLTLATNSDFHRDLIARRYGLQLKQVLSTMLHATLEVKFVVKQNVVEQTQEVIHRQPERKTAVMSQKTRWAATQNPTNNPQIDSLLETYGDMRGVILKSPIFKAPCTTKAEGGWEIGVGAMINACKSHTLEKVILAIKETKDYRGANDRGKFFFHVLRKGLESYQK